MDKPFRKLHVVNTELMILEKILTAYYEPTRAAFCPCKSLTVSLPSEAMEMHGMSSEKKSDTPVEFSCVSGENSVLNVAMDTNIYCN